MSATVDMDLAALEADARAKLEALEDAARRLAPEALAGDLVVLAELESIESEREAAARVLDRAAAAEAEVRRRAEEAEAEAKVEGCAAALGRAREIQQERGVIAKRIDKTLASFATDLGEYRALGVEQGLALGAAGLASAAMGAKVQPWQVAAAILHACRVAKLPRGFVPVESAPGGFVGSGSLIRPLAELTPQVVPGEEA